MRAELYSQFKKILYFKQNYHHLFKKHFTRTETALEFCKSLYNLENLSDDEKALFSTSEVAFKLLVDPLTYLLKAEIHQIDKEQTEKSIL